MIFEIQYLTQSGIVFDKCHKNALELSMLILKLTFTVSVAFATSVDQEQTELNSPF